MSLIAQTASQKSRHSESTHTGNKSTKLAPTARGVPLFLQKSSESGQSNKSQSDHGISSAIKQTQHTGSALPKSSRSGFESVLGHDLSKVRVHHNQQHNQLAGSLNAKAFTVGSDIFFGRGHYRPGTRDGDRLLAHELTHVVQQSSDSLQARQIEPGLRMGQANDCYEQEAVRVADEFVNDEKVKIKQNSIYSQTSRASDVIQLDEEDEQGFDYNLLPPALSYRGANFGVSADTSAAQLSYFNEEGRANLGYQYGGDLFYGTNFNGFSNRFGVNPQTGVGSMAFGGSHEGFRFGLNANTAGSFGLNLGYGAPLLPMPMMLGQQADTAWQGAYAMGGALPDFAADPLAAYGANSENIGAMSSFGRSMGNIYGQQGNAGLPFGAGFNLSYNPQQRWVVGAGLQGSF